MKKILILCFVLIISVVMAACANDEKAEKTNANNQSEVATKEEKEKTVDNEEKEEDIAKSEKVVSWEDKVKEVAASDGSTTEKHDEIVYYALDYKATDKEIEDFENFIIQEYKERNYLKNITNHEYMLGNIFKATVIDNHYEDSEETPMQDFAFDFLQNTKYNYRGAETAVSDSTLANEEQMNKVLQELQK